jgi:hypothetical protein
VNTALCRSFDVWFLSPIVALPIAPQTAMPDVPLKAIERDILKHAPLAHEPAISVKRLAKVAGYSYSSYLRAAVARLLDRGIAPAS